MSKKGRVGKDESVDASNLMHSCVDGSSQPKNMVWPKTKKAVFMTSTTATTVQVTIFTLWGGRKWSIRNVLHAYRLKTSLTIRVFCN